MKKIQFLNNNALKLIAALFMLIDHFGLIFFPNVAFIRCIGKISFPIFAYMIAEGCLYTRNKFKHLLIILLFGVVMQVIFVFFTRMTIVNIFLIFAIGIILIYFFDFAYENFKNKRIALGILFSVIFVELTFISTYLTWKGGALYDDFSSNYGCVGFLAPLLVYIFRKIFPNRRYLSLIILAIMMINKTIAFPAFVSGVRTSAYLLLGIIPLIFYNGEKGKLKIKYFFYIFYPVHLGFLYVLQLIIEYGFAETIHMFLG